MDRVFVCSIDRVICCFRNPVVIEVSFFLLFFRLSLAISRVEYLPRKPRRLPVGKGIIADFPHLLALP